MSAANGNTKFARGGEFWSFERHFREPVHNRQLVHTSCWRGSNGETEEPSLVTIDFNPVAAGTEIVVTHSGLQPAKRQGTHDGWVDVLGCIDRVAGEVHSAWCFAHDRDSQRIAISGLVSAASFRGQHMHAVLFNRSAGQFVLELRASDAEIAAFILRIRAALDGGGRSWSFAAGTFEVEDVGLGEINCLMLPDPAPSHSLRRVMDAIPTLERLPASGVATERRWNGMTPPRRGANMPRSSNR